MLKAEVCASRLASKTSFLGARVTDSNTQPTRKGCSRIVQQLTHARLQGDSAQLTQVTTCCHCSSFTLPQLMPPDMLRAHAQLTAQETSGFAKGESPAAENAARPVSPGLGPANSPFKPQFPLQPPQCFEFAAVNYLLRRSAHTPGSHAGRHQVWLRGKASPLAVSAARPVSQGMSL